MTAHHANDPGAEDRVTPGGTAGSMPEGERRLRALVRSFLSPGIWLVVTLQLMLQLLLPQGIASGESPDPMWLLALSILLAGFAYLQAGAFRALAVGRDRLTLAEVFSVGADRFARFLWMFFKLVLLGALAFNLLAFGFLSVSGMSLEAIVRGAAPFLGVLFSLFGFVFVYWLPWAFITDNFQLLATLRMALRTAWQRLPQSGFLAFLVLLPPSLFTLLPAGTSLWLLTPMAALASLLGWAAYIYCVEWLRDQTWPAPSIS